ncbi:uncharacterized protein LOC130974974 isoform X1 [Arachis stenosperma]|uniref:uncharacterized protein LOC130974974 isoform X1 n=1 Tax=Arachis stenosperma TaxID=217475 RepID=UPI0025ABBF4C|nr:uncharacterized protein LOC130974974 isoform X1 [Arachis stenosperma]
MLLLLTGGAKLLPLLLWDDMAAIKVVVDECSIPNFYGFRLTEEVVITMKRCIKDGTTKGGRSHMHMINPHGNNLHQCTMEKSHSMMHTNLMAMVNLLVTFKNHHHMPMSHILNTAPNHTHKPLLTKHLHMTLIHIHQTPNRVYKSCVLFDCLGWM